MCGGGGGGGRMPSGTFMYKVVKYTVHIMQHTKGKQLAGEVVQERSGLLL